ncbi:MAG: sulfite exporter TauE/SafE family protein [Candidatus Thermoplasmatota archaeon]|nr:sulfite exporter TauE/SafE family protein [Candidatus Thermoplasmatota archaeon]MBU4070749.1 sulfite exporter TauE/SafE family protein [Candidatus Thermoplasmatota archaeon]MBU4144742.1 sulfite exporter TauE/SafE family protein [Candidatus Thermoplasmatota archaeon]MBU4592844.1 sulfite exporter TauE/SafE family protein [Candidatus Thermoplasmatota archaeon]
MWLLVLGILAVFGISFIYSNLGMGGGVLFVPLLFWLTGYSEDTVVAISLCLVMANCITSLWNHQREKLVAWKLGWTMAIGAAGGTLLGVWFNINTGKEIFLGLFLAVVLTVIIKMLIDWARAGGRTRSRMGCLLSDWGIRRSVPRSRRRRRYVNVCESDDDSKLTKKRQAVASTGTVGAGFMSGALGLGGGVINVPLLLYVLGRCTKRAAGTSFVIMLVSGLVGLAGYLASGTYIDWTYVAALTPVVFAGSFIGSRWGIKKLKGRHVQLLFIMVLGIAVAKAVYDLMMVL